MNIENLKQRYPALLDHMQKNGYSSEYIHRTERQIENILSEASKWDSYHAFLHFSFPLLLYLHPIKKTCTLDDL